MKKAQSQIVTAVLLILIVIGLAVIILNFSTNFVQDKLSGTGCFDVADKVSFTSSSKYTCYNDTNRAGANADDILLQVHVGDVNDTLSGFLIETGGADTKSLEIRGGGNITGVSMYSGSATLVLPGRNEERTYVIATDVKPESVKIYPLLTGGQVCEASDVLDTIDLCR